MNDSSWSCAVELTSRFLNKPARLSHLLERLSAKMDPGSRRRCQFLLFGVVRNWSFLESNLDVFLRKRPRIGMWAALLVASYELMANSGKSAQIVDHAVGMIGKKFSKSEKALANAVLRKVAQRIAESKETVPSDCLSMAIQHSHPAWLIDRWIKQFGFEDASGLVRWNQEEPDIYFLPLEGAKAAAMGQSTDWDPYRKGTDTNWSELAEALQAGSIYIQNPGARLAPNLIVKHFHDGRILDLCAAPGGKSFYLEKILRESIREIVCVDLPGPRFERLLTNVKRFGSGRLRSLAADLFELDEKEQGRFEAVLLDAPCSNSGVLQKKPDAKWRLSTERISDLIALQFRMLTKASELVGENGLLVYSTCSVDVKENEGVVNRFLDSEMGRRFSLVERVASQPWITRHDGAGSALLRRQG